MHKEAEVGVVVQGDHIADECDVCKFGLKHGGLVKDYEEDRRSSKYVIIANLIGIYTVGVCPSIPFVLAQCGWFGIFVIIFSGWITWYSSYFLVKSLYSVKGHRLYDFTALGTHFFGYWTGKLIRVFTHIIQILSVGALAISILDNLKILFSNTNLPQLIDGNFAVSAILVVLTIAVPGYFVKTVNDTAFICFINPLYVVMICIVCIVQCRPDYTSNPPVYNAIVPPTLADGFSLLLFAFNGILSFPHLERTMKEPKSWDLSSFFAMLLTCCAFFLIGIMGYWAYGSSAEINFFSNLPQTWVIPALTIIFILQVYENCMSSMIVVIDEERPKLTNLKVNAILKELIRVVVYSIPYLIMWVSIVAIKRFNAFSNFTGSLNGIYLSVIMPPVFYVLGFGLRSNLFTLNGLSMTLMVLFGLTIGNYCVYITIIQL